MVFLDSMKNKKNIIGIVPARMKSARLHGKALKDIRGIPMLGHVYYRSKMSSVLDDVYLAISGEELEEYATSIGAKWVRDKKDNYSKYFFAISSLFSFSIPPYIIGIITFFKAEVLARRLYA